MKLAIDNGHLYFTITDMDSLHDGRPIILFLSGGPGLSYTNYNKALKPLEKIAHLVYHDPRGCGQSSDFPTETYTMENNIDDAEKLRAHLNLKKIIVFGFSYGAMLAQGYAIKYPAPVSHLILAAGATSYQFIKKAKDNLRTRGTKQQIDLCEKILWPGNFSHPDDLYELLHVIFPLYSCKVAAKTMPSPFAEKRPVPYAQAPINHAFQHDFFHFDYTQSLSKITCPTLILAGEHDWINDPCFAKEMHEKILNSELVLFKNSGHSMLTDVHEAFILAVLGWIGGDA
jgi:proline iminopeptidase